MIYLYTHTSSPRLQYICRLLFGEMMGVAYTITIDSEAFRQYGGAKINYSKEDIPGAYTIRNHPLLFEEIILPQAIHCFDYKNQRAFFKTVRSDHPFDILAASFYLVSRYEEYLLHEKDEYGRYAHSNSLAYKEGFLNKPLLHYWVEELAGQLAERFPDFQAKLPEPGILLTYDIDIAFSYKHKGLIRLAGGFLKSPSLERLKVLLGLQEDPFNSYQWLDQLHDGKIKPLYFFLVAAQNGVYDKNILPHKKVMWELVAAHAKKYNIGLHPSWQSGERPSLLQKEKEQLEAMCGHTITRSRQHYIRFELPVTYQQLLRAGITEDYSMGYGSINGFRASIAVPFNWYDLKKEEETALRVHPFCFMDANAFYEQKQNPAEALAEMLQYFTECRQHHGICCLIWHNNFSGTDKRFAGWREAYARFIAQALQ